MCGLKSVVYHTLNPCDLIDKPRAHDLGLDLKWAEDDDATHKSCKTINKGKQILYNFQLYKWPLIT